MVFVSFEVGAVRAVGHGQDETGCAVVSALLYALAGALENVCSPPLPWFIGSGEACIRYPPDDPGAAAMALMCEVGLRQVAAVREDVQVMDME